MGDNANIARWANCAPLPDTPGYTGSYPCFPFGSAHANGFQMALCDGSAQMIGYSIDPEIHRCLGVRNDGKAIDGKKL